jgi:hypothetical protein
MVCNVKLGYYRTTKNPGRAEVFSRLQNVQTTCGAHLAARFMLEGSLSPAVKWRGCHADHSSASSAEVKNEWSCTSTPI